MSSWHWNERCMRVTLGVINLTQRLNQFNEVIVLRGEDLLIESNYGDEACLK